MEVIGDQRPGVTTRLAFAYNPGQSIHKIITIIIGEKEFAAFDPTADDMV
jgi:hypothetical protein